MANPNGFREDELVCRKQKVNGEWSETYYPRVGGRLRLAHEGNDKLGIQTEVVRFEDSLAVVKATASTTKGVFCGFGTASAQRDARLADSLLELAETRSIARALRFSGYGVEYTSAEEVSHVITDEPEKEHPADKQTRPVLVEQSSTGEPETKPAAAKQNSGEPKATQAQIRAIRNIAFTRVGMSEYDLIVFISEFGAKDVSELSRQSASDVIQALQAQAA